MSMLVVGGTTAATQAASPDKATVATQSTPTQVAATTDQVGILPAATQDCPVHYACLWVDSNWSGSRWQGQYNNPTLPSFINNQASSSFNNGTSCTAHFTTNAGYAGNVLSEGIGSIRQNLALDYQPNGQSWNDTIESLYWCSKG